MPSGGEAAKSLIASWLSSDVIACSELSELLLAFTPGIKPAKIVHNTSTLANFVSVFKVDLLLLWAKQGIYVTSFLVFRTKETVSIGLKNALRVVTSILQN